VDRRRQRRDGRPGTDQMTASGAGLELSGAERRLVDAVDERRDDVVALLERLIGFDTTTREVPEAPARDDAALQGMLADRLSSVGFTTDLWEPAGADVDGHPLSLDGDVSFDGRPQLIATAQGPSDRPTLMFNGHVDVVRADEQDGWSSPPFRAVVRDGFVFGRGACDMKGGIAAMVVAAEVLVEEGLEGGLVVCTNTDEESSGIGALACVARGIGGADAAIVTEPTGLEVWPACRGGVYCNLTVPGRAGHAEQEHDDWREGGAVSAIERARHLLAGLDLLRSEWRSRHAYRHPLLAAPDIVVTRLVADEGWPVIVPGAAELTFAALIVPAQTDAAGWTAAVQQEIEGFLRTWCVADPWLAEHPPRFEWYGQTNPSETPSDAAPVQALLSANAALDLPVELGALGSWYDGATYGLQAGIPVVMYGPRHIDWAHAVDERVPIDDLVACAKALAIATHRYASASEGTRRAP